jgi:hypothetical protein
MGMAGAPYETTRTCENCGGTVRCMAVDDYESGKKVGTALIRGPIQCDGCDDPRVTD